MTCSKGQRAAGFVIVACAVQSGLLLSVSLRLLQVSADVQTHPTMVPNVLAVMRFLRKSCHSCEPCFSSLTACLSPAHTAVVSTLQARNRRAQSPVWALPAARAAKPAALVAKDALQVAESTPLPADRAN